MWLSPPCKYYPEWDWRCFLESFPPDLFFGPLSVQHNWKFTLGGFRVFSFVLFLASLILERREAWALLLHEWYLHPLALLDAFHKPIPGLQHAPVCYRPDQCMDSACRDPVPPSLVPWACPLSRGLWTLKSTDSRRTQETRRGFMFTEDGPKEILLKGLIWNYCLARTTLHWPWDISDQKQPYCVLVALGSVQFNKFQFSLQWWWQLLSQ